MLKFKKFLTQLKKIVKLV